MCVCVCVCVCVWISGPSQSKRFAQCMATNVFPSLVCMCLSVWSFVDRKQIDEAVSEGCSMELFYLFLYYSIGRLLYFCCV